MCIRDSCYIDDYSATLNNILGELYWLYMSDLAYKQKVIKTPDMMKKALKRWTKLMSDVSFDLFSSGRLEKFYKSRHGGSLYGIENIDKSRENSVKNFAKLVLQEKTSAMNIAFLKMISSDGKVYMYDNYSIIPTDIQLNTGNKSLKTPFWTDVKDFVVTTDMIDRI